MPRKVIRRLTVNGTQIATITELQEQFRQNAHVSLKDIVKAYFDGELCHWLTVQRHDAQLAAVKKLSADPNPQEGEAALPDHFTALLCEALGVTCEIDTKPEEIRRQLKEDEKKSADIRARLENATDDPAVLAAAAQTALTQDDLVFLYSTGKKQITLFGSGCFTIDLQYTGITYSQVGNPQVLIAAKDNCGLADCGITLNGIKFGWDVSGVTENDAVQRAEQALYTEKHSSALHILKDYAEKQHPRALLLLEISEESETETQVYADAGSKLGSVQSGIRSKKEPNKLQIIQQLAKKGNPLDLGLCGLALLTAGFDQEGMRLLLESSLKDCAWAKHELDRIEKETEAASCEKLPRFPFPSAINPQEAAEIICGILKISRKQNSDSVQIRIDEKDRKASVRYVGQSGHQEQEQLKYLSFSQICVCLLCMGECRDYGSAVKGTCAFDRDTAHYSFRFTIELSIMHEVLTSYFTKLLCMKKPTMLDYQMQFAVWVKSITFDRIIIIEKNHQEEQT